MYVGTYVCMYVYAYVHMYVCMYVCMYICMYVCTGYVHVTIGVGFCNQDQYFLSSHTTK